jgi:prepilin-type N-terminal cleavage/methylation domain-containing protein
MNMKTFRSTSTPRQGGFTLLELMLVCAILSIVMGAVFNSIRLTIARSQAEQVKVDLTQQGREFVDEFQRDLHQAGYPNCRIVGTAGVVPNCPTDYTQPTAVPVEQNTAVAIGLVYVSSTKIIFEGAVDGTGTVYSIQYRLVDVNGNDPPTTNCPCTLQRSEVVKKVATPFLQTPAFMQELPNVVNSGQPVAGAFYGGGLAIQGTTAWGATNSAYYAAVSTFKDYPVFQAYAQDGTSITLPRSVNTAGDTPILTCSVSSIDCIKSIRLTLNLLANANTGADIQTKVRPVTTLVGNARLVNN